MCGIVGVVGRSHVNQLLYDSLLLLQHRGQDAAGIATSDNRQFYLHKSHGLVRDVFRAHNMLSLPGYCGIGQVRYPTSGSNVNEQEAQPFYVNAPFGIMFAHNGNLTNWKELRESLFKVDLRHINTNSDSEVLLNVFANELQSAVHGVSLDENSIFQAISGVHRRVRGAYAVVSIISGYGLVAFRDVNGIRPLCIGRQETNSGTEWMVASESVALEGNGFTFVRDVDPGEAIFIDMDSNLFSKQCADNPKLSPCIFEYIYFSRPDSFIDKVPVYDARLRMGEYLAKKLTKYVRTGDIDVVIPIPDSSRPAAMQLAHSLNINYREGLIKNRYVGRTFIMPGQAMRRKSVRQKLNTINMEFKNKNILLVDDSIVRGTTSKEIVEMARSSGANKVYFASAAAQIKHQNVYGIDMPTQSELIASNRTDEEIAKFIGADALIYQDLDDMKKSITDINNSLTDFDASCFDGIYVTGDIDSIYLSNLSNSRVS
ncbi:amidophosphoribosyltransferase [Candidatus Kinetoplastibacterium blastocrithidii TCC012E]|uniref:Amidophosphoribosyltransferase n=1 Tax=Candidatus Kinetoplastidibacterium blastocrithidiae TCC012E TaxID=1208922 RepID=M1M0F1_9PROT|nr:amidophosphoribosyltransferase [Candidatus Kinetoplastibacterium blastocrithidii]AFZ83625.1 amidophosphoribosyltransferase [Candidatus Kinetoplastibacterium blastocrithidii (ex Strigomonas culicis)]AGF49746.1 amidophosphoribosyltransferase [Candidatus Kinetoplastibacterium blastocrithidii TCC012E]